MYAVKIWLTLSTYAIRSYDGSKNVEVFFETPCTYPIIFIKVQQFQGKGIENSQSFWHTANFSAHAQFSVALTSIGNCEFNTLPISTKNV